MSLPLVAIERASGSVSEICLSSLFIISALIALSRATSSFSFAMSFADAIAMIAAAEELPEQAPALLDKLGSSCTVALPTFLSWSMIVSWYRRARALGHERGRARIIIGEASGR